MLNTCTIVKIDSELCIVLCCTFKGDIVVSFLYLLDCSFDKMIYFVSILSTVCEEEP